MRITQLCSGLPNQPRGGKEMRREGRKGEEFGEEEWATLRTDGGVDGFPERNNGREKSEMDGGVSKERH